MTGKEKCKFLKDIRRQIAEENGIDLEIEECTYEGECEGTCPKCDAELNYLMAQLNKKAGAPDYDPVWIAPNGIPIREDRRIMMGKIVPPSDWKKPPKD